MLREVQQVRKIVLDYLKNNEICEQIGLPEIDDRYNEWKISILNKNNVNIGTIHLNAENGEISERSSKISDLKKRQEIKNKKIKEKQNSTINNLENTIIVGDSLKELEKLPEQSVHLIFTSPPYYNARVQYSEYDDYDSYLEFMSKIIDKCNRLLINGRFFVINVSPILVPRINRSSASMRYPLPFDLHAIFKQHGFEFIDDIVWLKPEGAGWATSRGRRFAADRNPLQYKSVPVTENILVYRKNDGKLIDWHIRNNENPESKIGDDYERTNVWKISPARSKHHPAIFPIELAEKVIKYYSFVNEMILDPFSGIGTVGNACINLKRKYCLIEKEEKYLSFFRKNIINKSD